MAEGEDKPPGLSIVARVEERWLTPLRRASSTRAWNLVTAAAICAIYAAVIGFFLYRDAHTPVQTARVEEIPVEVLPPPPPPPPPRKPPQPEAKRELEKPASSAPRAPSEEKIETERKDDSSHAPKAATPTPIETPSPPEPPAASSEAAGHDDAAAAPKSDVLEKDAEALAKAVPEPPTKPETLAKTPPKTPVRRDKPAPQRATGKSDQRDTKLARQTKKAPITGGNEDNRYLANVYAKIMANYRPIAVDADGAVTVAFNVDDDGTILNMTVVRSSGDDDLDAAALAAVSRASPLPPLPAGAPHGLIAHIGAGSAPPGGRDD